MFSAETGLSDIYIYGWTSQLLENSAQRTELVKKRLLDWWPIMTLSAHFATFSALALADYETKGSSACPGGYIWDEMCRKNNDKIHVLFSPSL